MLTVRCHKMLLDFLNTPKAISRKNLEVRYRVSERSIKYDLARIRDYLTANFPAIKLAKVPGEGLILQGSSKDIESLKQRIGEDSESLTIFPSERVRQLIFILLLRQNYIAANKLAEYLQVSKHTITRDLETVSEVFHAWNINLKRKTHFGIRLITSESKRRQALEYFTRSMLSAQDIEDTLTALRKGVASDALRTIICRYLLPTDKLNTLCRHYPALLTAIDNESLIQPRRNNLELFIRLVVSVAEIKKHIRIEEIKGKIFWSGNIKNTAAIILEQLFKELELELDSQEMNWLLLPLASDIKLTGEIPLEQLTRELIRRVSCMMKLPFSADGELYENLLLHMQRTLRKNQSYIVNVNPLIDDILTRFRKLFMAVKPICCDLFDRYAIYFHDEDISYIVLYFQLSYETMFGKVHIPTLVVCSTGTSSAKLLIRQLQNRFEQLYIIGSCSANEVPTVIAATPARFVISVLPLAINIPHVVVNAILEDDDVQKIRGVLATFQLQSGVKSHPLYYARPKILSAEHRQLEQFAEDVICRGFDIFGHLTSAIDINLDAQRERGLLLHCLLLANRLTLDTPYTDILPVEKHNSAMTALSETIRQTIRPYYKNIPESEIIAILNYFIL